PLVTPGTTEGLGAAPRFRNPGPAPLGTWRTGCPAWSRPLHARPGASIVAGPLASGCRPPPGSRKPPAVPAIPWRIGDGSRLSETARPVSPKLSPPVVGTG